jgi:hypothetical protein
VLHEDAPKRTFFFPLFPVADTDWEGEARFRTAMILTSHGSVGCPAFSVR